MYLNVDFMRSRNEDSIYTIATLLYTKMEDLVGLQYSTAKKKKTATTALLLLAGLYAPHPGYHQTRPLDDGRKICE